MNTKTHIHTSAAASLSRGNLLRSVCGIAAFVLLLAVSAELRFYLPGTAVPVTMQTLVVLLAPVVLGTVRGSTAVAIYLSLGMTGWGVFTPAKAVTAGYLVGFFLAQPVIGLLLPWAKAHYGRMAGVMLAGNAVIFAAGLFWLAALSQFSASPLALLGSGLLPFLPGMALKTALATVLACEFVRRQRPS